MSLVASFCKGVNKHRFGKRYYAMPMVRKKNVRRSGGPVNGSLTENPQSITQPLGTTDRIVLFFFLPNPPDATRPNCPTTLATTANHRAHDGLRLAHTHKTCAQLQLLLTLTTPAGAGGIAKRHTPTRYRRAIGRLLAPARPGCADGGPLATCSTWQ